MEGIIFDFRSFSVHDGPGIRTTIFLKGCPLRCMWCHNPESFSQGPETVMLEQRLGKESFTIREQIGTKISVEKAMSRLLADRPFFENSNGGLTISGGEPLMQYKFVDALLIEAKKLDIHTALDTSGHAAGQIFQESASRADLVLFDLKLADSKAHFYYTNQHNHVILRNLNWLAESTIPFIIRIPLIPDITDTASNMEALYQILKNLPRIEQIDLLPYHHLAKGKYERLGLTYPLENIQNYDKKRINPVKERLESLGVPVLIGG